MTWFNGSIAAIAVMLTGCTAHDAVESEPTPATTSRPVVTTSGPVAAPSVSQAVPTATAPAPRPVSALAPGLTLPRNSVDLAATEYPHMELWAYGGDYRPTAQIIAEQLPLGQSYDGMAWCTGDDVSGGYYSFNPTTQWSWGDAAELLVITVTESGRISITRGPEEGDDRSDCDVP